MPKGNGIAGASSSACCDRTIGGVTKKTIDGTEYAFPLAGATQSNYLNASTFPGESVLSRLPCNDYSPGTCHHDYHAVDMGIMMEMVTGKDPTADDYGGESGFSNMYYNSAGATVVAITAGTVEYVGEYKNGETRSWSNNCTALDSDGRSYDGVLKNCVSFTKWFVYTYVDIPAGFEIQGDGAQVVGYMKGDGFPTGTEPRPYVVFSWSNSGYGHTGIVLGVNDDGSFIVGESSCSARWDSPMIANVGKHTLDDHDWTFAYTDDYIKF